MLAVIYRLWFRLYWINKYISGIVEHGKLGLISGIKNRIYLFAVSFPEIVSSITFDRRRILPMVGKVKLVQNAVCMKKSGCFSLTSYLGQVLTTSI